MDEIHFYENFLAAHDPELRRSLGVFYTPQPAVSYIVKAVDDVLRQDFKLRDGLADTAKVDIDGKEFHRVQILDPATGVGTFLFEVIEQIHQRIKGKYGLDAWRRYVPEHLLPRLHGFEVMETPYKIAHQKFTEYLQSTGYKLGAHQRFNIHLTNALESQEKYEQFPIMVVIGNPPYNVSTMNKNKFSVSLLANYKEGLGEKKTNLDDDYIKFIALGQRFIDRNNVNSGILAYISNNSFLDGVTHRNMRKSLLRTFDKIYIINLHGDARKKETAPDGSKDENVFNIMQGTCINIFVRSPEKNAGEQGKVFYLDLFGKRSEKYQFLETQSLITSGFTELDMSDQFYSFFAPKDFSTRKEYNKGFSVEELFLLRNSGIKSDRDSLFIDDDKEQLAKRIKTLLSGDYDWRFEDRYRVEDSSGYKLTKVIQGKKFNRQFLRQIYYRPFDKKWIYYDPSIISRAAEKVMQHMIDKDNVCLLTSRLVPPNQKFNRIFVSTNITDGHAISDQTYVFPLYTYSIDGSTDPNMSPEIVRKIAERIGKKHKLSRSEEIFNYISVLDIFDYVYGVLHDMKYRERHQEFLKIDFPKIPYPKNAAAFDKYVQIGSRLRRLHLLEDVPELHTTFPIADGNVVENIRFVDGKVYINKTQYFGNVPVSAWEFYIGGYQPLQKYLKDRKGRVLTFEEIQHYQKIVAVLSETIDIQNGPMLQ